MRCFDKAILVASVALCFNLSAFSQDITLKTNNITVKEAIEQIKKSSGYSFVFSSLDLDTKKRVSISVKDAVIEEVVKQLLKGQSGLSYEIQDKKVIIKRARQPLNREQQGEVTGRVIDVNGEPVIGATVIVQGTSNGTITDFDGNFTLNAMNNAVLEISYIGYETRQLKPQNGKMLVVTLKEDTQALEEVVVVGYGTQRKVNLTGSIGTIKADKALKARSVTNVQELLAGSVPGMTVTKGSGAVGSGATINIHGTSTIGGSSGVLILIDGVPGNLYTLNPNDIESISILKDAASASIYGSRAANGVMLVTTKKGQTSERLVVDFSTNIGIQNPQFKLDFVGAEDYMRLYDEAMVNDGKAAFFGEQGIQDLKNGKYADNKWYKEIYRKNTLINNTHVAVSGKEKSITYRFSLSNDYQEGTLPNNDYNRLIFKPDLHFQLLKNLSAQVNLQYTQTSIKNPQGGTTIWQTQAARISPVTPIYEANGLYGVGSSMGGNPIAGVNEAGYSKERHKEMLAIFSATYTPLKDWNIKANISAYTHDQTTKTV